MLGSDAPTSVHLILYVSAMSTYTVTAVNNCHALLDRFDRTRVRFEVCDISQEPERAEADAVCYTPMLLKRFPPPRTYVLGTLSNVDALVRLLESCGLEPSR